MLKYLPALLLGCSSTLTIKNPASEDTAAEQMLLDQDADGYRVIDGDCNDHNPDIHPNAIETPYDGEDNDCDPSTLDDDIDQDGFLAEEDCNDQDPYLSSDCPTIDNDEDGFSEDQGDCDDSNPELHPDALDATCDGIDQNCNGERDESWPDPSEVFEHTLITDQDSLNQTDFYLFPFNDVDTIYFQSTHLELSITSSSPVIVTVYTVEGSEETFLTDKIVEFDRLQEQTNVVDRTTEYAQLYKILVSPIDPHKPDCTSSYRLKLGG